MAISNFRTSSIRTGSTRNTMWDQVTFNTSYESIETITVGSSGQSSISFTSIPQTYKHLQLRAIAKTVSNDQGVFLQFNGDTAANYSSHYMYGTGNGGNPIVGANTTWAGMYCSPTFSSQFSGLIVDILDYTNTNKLKTVRSIAGVENNGSGYATITSGNWRNSNAITSISIKEILANSNFTQFSHFALYGIKG